MSKSLSSFLSGSAAGSGSSGLNITLNFDLRRTPEHSDKTKYNDDFEIVNQKYVENIQKFDRENRYIDNADVFDKYEAWKVRFQREMPDADEKRRFNNFFANYQYAKQYMNEENIERIPFMDMNCEEFKRAMHQAP